MGLKRRRIRTGQATRGRRDQTGGDCRKVAVRVRLRRVVRKTAAVRREAQSVALQALPVKVMRSRRTKSGPGSSEGLTSARKHSQENRGFLTLSTALTSQTTSKSTGGFTSATKTHSLITPPYH